MLTPGVRVIRGPDWAWQYEGYTGTVCRLEKTELSSSLGKNVFVQWDSGFRKKYRIEYQGQFNFRVIDNAQIGVKHTNIICEGCKKFGIAGMRFKCIKCDDYNLCSLCYHADVHDLSHPFQRFDMAESQGVDLSIRKYAPKCELKGIFVGARVIRRHNLEFEYKDYGRVMKILDWDNESARSVANVTWMSGPTNVYRLGHEGNCDLKFVQESSGGMYYIEHLPALSQHKEVKSSRSVNHQLQNAIQPSLFNVGDEVKLAVNVDTLKSMQLGHGGLNPPKLKYAGKIGTVHRVTESGDIQVQYEGCNSKWTFNPSAFCKVNTFLVGDFVYVLNDQEKLSELYNGKLIDIMKNALAKLGKVIKVYSGGDLQIQLDGHTWTLNSQCVRLVPELSNTMGANRNQQLGRCMLPATSNGSAKTKTRQSVDVSRKLAENPNKKPRKSRQRVNEEIKNEQEASPRHVSKMPEECSVCSELSEENASLEPCGHKPACEDCASRMKKCFQCGMNVKKRITKDGRVITPKNRQSSAARMKYLEYKLAEIEQTNECSICMEQRKNVLFLCGHSTCAKCAGTLNICPMCREIITKKIPIY